MKEAFFISDPHFGHDNICKFLRADGSKLRPFETAEEMDETIIKNWNSVVNSNDRVYVLGDIAMKKVHVSTIARCNGRKVLIPGNHDCLDAETECLTLRGWTHFSELTTDDFVWSIAEDGLGRWAEIDDIIIKDYCGDMVSLDAQRMSFSVTPNHRFAHLTADGLVYSKANSLPADFRIVTAAKSTTPEYPISDMMLELLGWVYSDGCITKYKGLPHSVDIYQSKLHGCKIIEALLVDMNLTFSRNTRNKKDDGFSICGKVIKSQLTPNVFSINVESSKEIIALMGGTKKVLAAWFKSLSDRQFSVFLKALISGDGSWATNGLQNAAVIHGIKGFLDSVQEVCITKGINASITKFRESDFRLNVNFNKQSKIYQKRRQEVCGSLRNEAYSGVVWCINTQHTNFMVRRRGMSFITGNCFEAKEYLKYFEDIRGVYVLPARDGILSHIPLHPESIGRFKVNIHGHVHANDYPSPNYFSVCVENINYTPISRDELKVRIQQKREALGYT